MSRMLKHDTFDGTLRECCFILCFISLFTWTAINSGNCEQGPEAIRFLEPGESDPILAEREASESEISVREINMLHLALLDRCFERLTEKQKEVLSLQYEGIVVREDSRKEEWSELEGLRLRKPAGFRVLGDYGSPLCWTVQDQDGNELFGIWVSVRKTPQTVAECAVGKRILHLNVSSIAIMPGVSEVVSDWKAAKELLDRARPQLGDRSIVEFLNLLKEKNPGVEE